MTNGTAERVFNLIGMRQSEYAKGDVGVYQGKRKTSMGNLRFIGSIGGDVLSFSAELDAHYPLDNASARVEIVYSPKMGPAEVAGKILEGLKEFQNSDSASM